MKLIESIKKKWFCCHEWKKLHTVEQYKKPSDEMPCNVEIILVCKKCGKIKKIKV